MEDNMISAKVAVAAFFTSLGTFLGWQGIMALVWICVMALDYLTGTLAACYGGTWNSTKAREGLWHKGGMIAIVAVAAITDGIMAVICANLPLNMEWPGIILPLVLASYIITELGSIVENAVKMGAPVPDWLIRLFEISTKVVDGVGESVVQQLPDSLNSEHPDIAETVTE